MEDNKNMELYNAVREVPETAQKLIAGGRLKGKTDINPMWRIKTLTEQFGICGFGWTVEVLEQWLDSQANGEVMAHVKIALHIKRGDEWSKPIIGLGGSMAASKDRNGVYVSDECYKMAYTDAISVACKMLGIGADIYWDADSTKYTAPEQPSKVNIRQRFVEDFINIDEKKKNIFEWLYNKEMEMNINATSILKKFNIGERNEGSIDVFLQDYESYRLIRNYNKRNKSINKQGDDDDNKKNN